ncbi:hypothetical protein Lgra_2598 [Legionella gratiana]|uniref:Guanylate cyclase domain-containing protein n=1 Tax=Legionella gratiana TaxID=45066 RepID=A0A378J5G4_9GAMM|nr:hypothetical protein [Legionella gratiana]KTD05821.1 hypothetical protein Lgra_2598 [Legionella gratiana]STX42167.1 Uncharacterised protein [Legionella gratiana]
MVNVNYEDRAILFVDILGWTEALKRKSANEIHCILSPFIQQGNEHNEHRCEEIRQRVADDDGLSSNPLYMSVQVSFFSDCFVCSMPSEFASQLCNRASHIIRDFLSAGFLVRGGLSAGKLYHKDQIVFGPALLRAYEIEHKEAIFPRVIIDSLLINCLNEDFDEPVILKDQLGNYVVDPFPIIFRLSDAILTDNYKIDNIIEVINSHIKNAENSKVRDLWRFQAALCNLSLKKYGNREIRRRNRLKRISG